MARTFEQFATDLGAMMNRGPVRDNPYKRGTPSWHAWNRGYVK